MQSPESPADPFGDHDQLFPAGQFVGPPPLILGHRGSPREAPENTLGSLRRALDVGLDGIEYDLRACAGGELILLHDETLQRTTDSKGPLAQRNLASLMGVDAGSWHSHGYRGERLPLFDEALELTLPDGRPAMHMIEIKERGLLDALLERLEDIGALVDLRVAAFDGLELAKLPSGGPKGMLLVDRVDDGVISQLAEHRFPALGVGPGGWDHPAWSRLPKGIERWAWSVDSPADLLRVCSGEFTGFNTNEPHRALAARALVRLVPDLKKWPLEVPRLMVVPEGLNDVDRERGEWFGRWEARVKFTNPLPVPIEVRLGFFSRGGAFNVEGLPMAATIQVGETLDVSVRIDGGSRSPGPDPLVGAAMSWQGSLWPGSLAAGGRLLLDAPLVRERRAWADTLTTRLTLLAESAGDLPASVVLRRRGQRLSLRIEHAGGLEGPVLVARLGQNIERGAPGVELILPRSFDENPSGLDFSVGIEGLRHGILCRRRWAGGLPPGLGHGSPGRLLPEREA